MFKHGTLYCMEDGSEQLLNQPEEESAASLTKKTKTVFINAINRCTSEENEPQRIALAESFIQVIKEGNLFGINPQNGEVVSVYFPQSPEQERKKPKRNFTFEYNEEKGYLEIKPSEQERWTLRITLAGLNIQERRKMLTLRGKSAEKVAAIKRAKIFTISFRNPQVSEEILWLDIFQTEDDRTNSYQIKAENIRYTSKPKKLFRRHRY